MASTRRPIKPSYVFEITDLKTNKKRETNSAFTTMKATARKFLDVKFLFGIEKGGNFFDTDTIFIYGNPIDAAKGLNPIASIKRKNPVA